MPQTRLQKKKESTVLISATELFNYIKNDRILDYFDLLNSKGYTINDNLKISKKRTRSFDNSDVLDNMDNMNNTDNIINITNSNDLDELKIQNNIMSNNNYPNKKRKSSQDYIFEGGYLFEYEIVGKIKQMMKNANQEKKLIEIDERDRYLNAIKTIQIIKKNSHTIILGSVVINSSNNTWGKPDLIVKGSWIRKYIEKNFDLVDTAKWYIIDIKSSSIQLVSGGEDIGSKLLYSCYKSQVYIYTCALNQSLKDYGITNDVKIGFIMGKKYKFVQNKIQIIKNSFDTLGIINFDKEKNKGNDLNLITNSGIQWLDYLKKNWKDFTINPINKNELYPNMTNVYNKNWSGIKKKIAEANKEITLLWSCGLTNREKAWKQKIKSYADPKLTPEILGFDKSNSKYNIIDKMLKLLHDEENNFILDSRNNLMDWQNKYQWEFFVDFETYNYDDIIWDDVNDWDNIYNGCQKIYMCGISWIDSETSKLVHKSFVIKYSNNFSNLKKEFEKSTNTNSMDVQWSDYIECVDELDLIKQIKNFINSFKPIDMDCAEYFTNTRLIHWSGAEPILYNKKITEYGLDLNEYKLNWYDLLNVFKHSEYPIILKECFGFGLKVIVKKLNQYKQIDIVWPELDDGFLSSLIARDIYLNNMDDSDKQMLGIIHYNWIDCKATWEVLEWMRKIVKISKVTNKNNKNNKN